MTKQRVPNKAEARRVRAIFRRAAAGELPTQIAAASKKWGWRTKVYESKRSGKVTGGGRKTSNLSGIAYRYYSCRSPAGGRPRCEGVQYPAYEVERYVEGLPSSPDTWRGLLGQLPSEKDLRAAIKAWSVAPYHLRGEILRQGIQRVEFRHRNSGKGYPLDSGDIYR